MQLLCLPSTGIGGIFAHKHTHTFSISFLQQGIHENMIHFTSWVHFKLSFVSCIVQCSFWKTSSHTCPHHHHWKTVSRNVQTVTKAAVCLWSVWVCQKCVTHATKSSSAFQISSAVIQRSYTYAREKQSRLETHNTTKS